MKFYVQLYNGYCTILDARTENGAMTQVQRDFSREELDYQGCEPKSAHKATDEELAWCNAMMGIHQ